MTKRLIFLRVGISVSFYKMVFICLNTAWMSQQTMWKCSLSDLRRVIHTPVSNTCLSREQLFNSSSKKNQKTKHSTVATLERVSKRRVLVWCYVIFFVHKKPYYISLAQKNTAKNSNTSR